MAQQPQSLIGCIAFRYGDGLILWVSGRVGSRRRQEDDGAIQRCGDDVGRVSREDELIALTDLFKGLDESVAQLGMEMQFRLIEEDDAVLGLTKKEVERDVDDLALAGTE